MTAFESLLLESAYKLFWLSLPIKSVSVTQVTQTVCTLAKACQTGSLWVISDFFLHFTLAYKATSEL